MLIGEDIHLFMPSHRNGRDIRMKSLDCATSDRRYSMPNKAPLVPAVNSTKLAEYLFTGELIHKLPD